MNSFVNVQVRIIAAQAQAQLAQLNARLNGLQGGFNRAQKSGMGFMAMLAGTGLASFGSRVQWAGRQLEYNFTLPIVAAGTAAMKMALDNEAAMTRITKVYGDATHDAQFYHAEIEALGRSFEELSNIYGVNQAETLNVAANWAAAGASGLALAKSVDLTMQTMILGEMNAAEATQALISIQAQYGFGVADLAKTIATLNMVENQTGISLKGLVQGFERSAGVARSTGVDVRHLAAMLAALTPATGGAAQAGNALKTIFSRLISPTKETTQVLGLMGIHISDLSWKSATMTDRLIVMAKKFEGLSDAQKGVVSSVAASRWQVNKFEVLMRELINTNGYYQKALQATASDTQVFNQMNKELTAVLSSNPRRLQIIWTMLQNAAADIITPMIPLILYLAQAIQTMVTAFSKLPQPVQLTVLGLLAFLAVMGPIVRIFGAVTLMIAEVGKLFIWLAGPIGMAASALGFLVRIPVSAFLFLISGMVRTAIFSLGLLSQGAMIAMRGLSVALLTGAAIAGSAWRAGFSILQTITIGGWAAIGVIWRRALFLLEGVMLAGARAIGIAWRAGLMLIAAIQSAFSAVMSVSWSGMFLRVVGIVGAGFRGITLLFTRFVPTIRALSTLIMSAFAGPWGIAIAAVLFLVFAFWDDLKKLWSALVRGTVSAFNALPKGILGAMQAVVNIVKQAALAVYNLFSYLNPWAHHSPSLVENVTSGMDAVVKQFARAKNMGDVFKQAYGDLQRFGKALALLKAKSDAADFADMRKSIKGVDPGALASFDRLVKILPTLKSLLASLKPALDAQSAVVDKWKTKLDAANDALDEQQKKLKALQDVADAYQNELQNAQAQLDKFANAPIQGEKEMGDAIFDNQMKQKKLRLELMKMEDAVGPMDKLQDKINAINGQIEMLKGTQADLRNAGAGSEILSQYDAQIKALQDQQKAIDAQLAPMQDLSDQIDDLGRKAEELDLEKSLKFDPLKKQIDDVVNSMKELPFDEILAGVTKNKAEVDRLTEAYNKAKAAVDKQQGVVDEYTKQRDAIQARYDAESKALEKLQKQYDAYEQQIRDIEQALKDAGAAADTIARGKKGGAGGGGGSLTPGAENFMAGAGGNFGDPGGFAQIGREGGFGDQSKLIDDFTKEMANKTKNMFGMFNFLDPIKKGWNTAWNWVKGNIGPVFSGLAGQISGWFGGFHPFDGMSKWVDTIKRIGGDIWNAMKFVWRFIGPEVINTAKRAWKGLQDAFAQIQPEIAKFRDLVGPAGEALGNVWKVLKPIMTVILGLALAIAKGLWRAISNAVGPIIKGIGALIGGIIRIIRGLYEFVIGVFTGNWSRAWQGIVDIVSGIWKAIWGVISNLGKAIWGIVSGFISGIIGFFTQLYDELVGHSIIPDMVNAIISWFASLPGKVWNAMVALVSKVGTIAKNAFNSFMSYASKGWDVIAAWIATLPGKAVSFLNSLVPGLGDKAKAAFNNFMNGAKAIWSIIQSWITGRPSDAAAKISAIVGALRNKAVEAMTSFRNGLVDKWNDVVSWVSGVGGRVRNAVGNLGSLLVSAGRAIMQSLWDGLKAKWEEVKNWVGSLADKIKALKGPIEKDRVLLVDEGGAIMDSLGRGMRGSWSGVEGWLGTVGGMIQNTLAAANKLNNFRTTIDSVAARNPATISGNTSHSETKVFNFYGDLSFPSIDSETDAEEFLRNLESIVRS